MLTAIFYLALFLVGAAVGSFASVVIYRLHSGKKGIFFGRSACRRCDAKLAPFDLVPIASYLILRGKCRSCNKEISRMYPLLELCSGAIFALLFWKFPFLNEALQFSERELALYALHGFYAFILIVTFFFDLEYMEVADEILLPAIVIGLIATIAAPATPNIISALIGTAIGAAFFGLQILVSRGTWVGTGDLRVGAFMGVILGWKLLLIALFVSYIIGSVVAVFVLVRKKKFLGVKIPFAPILATGTFITIFYGEELLALYLNGIGL